MSAKRLPYMPFFVADWLADLHVRAMTAAARGAYIDLLALTWQDGPLPNDPSTLARMTGVTEQVIRREVLPRFRVKSGRLVHEKIERIRDEQIASAVARSEKATTAVRAREAKRRASQDHLGDTGEIVSGSSSGHPSETPRLRDSEAKKLEPPLTPPPPAGGERVLDALEDANGAPQGPLRRSPATAGRKVRIYRRCHRCVDGRRDDGTCCGCRIGRRRADCYRRRKSDDREHAEIKAAGRLPRSAKGGMASIGDVLPAVLKRPAQTGEGRA